MKLLRILIKMVVYSTIIIFLFGLYTTYIERELLITKKHNIELRENGKDEIKIAQFSDTHLGEYFSLEQLEKVVKKINKVNPDIVVFTGDLMDNAAEYSPIEETIEILSKIDAKIGKYAVYGNRDYGGGAVRFYRDMMEKSGFVVLSNQNETINIRNRKLHIMGGDDALMGEHNPSTTVGNINEEDINILLLHEPDLVDQYNGYPIDLALAGHSHGGQVYIPFYGPIKRNVLSEKYNKGFYELENSRGSTIYVNTGIGNTKVPFRFFNVPEISVFKIKF